MMFEFAEAHLTPNQYDLSEEELHAITEKAIPALWKSLAPHIEKTGKIEEASYVMVQTFYYMLLRSMIDAAKYGIPIEQVKATFDQLWPDFQRHLKIETERAN